jgi:hypothetical protein
MVIRRERLMSYPLSLLQRMSGQRDARPNVQMKL